VGLVDSIHPTTLNPDLPSWPQRLIVLPEQAGRRLDVFLAEQLPTFSRSTLRRAIDAGHVHVDNAPCKASLRLDEGSIVTIDQVAAPREGPKPQQIPLDILYEDDAIIVINKRAGMIVHPARGHWEGTLASALAHHFGTLSSRGGPTRPGIVHRLDRETSGVIVIAKNDQAHDALAAQFKSREVKKEYLAIVLGVPDRDRDVVNEPIGDHPTQREKKAIRREDLHARPAVTVFETVERFAGYALVRALPRTGRTHQIRIHLAHIRHPVLCDKLYGGGRTKITELELIPTSQIAHDNQTKPENRLLDRHALHAHRLTITNPTTGQLIQFEAPLPPDLENTLAALRKWRSR
jgi:23S rRNA pseudouridine1911/1915/1917 synthase